MELSQFTDYALRVLIYVGMRQPQRTDVTPMDGDMAAEAKPISVSLSSVREIAAAFQISQNHLVKVVHRLGQLGYIDTFRGRGGGIALALAPADICIGTVVRQTENLAIVQCFSDTTTGGCCIAPACELKRVLERARAAFLASLDACTLADLLKPQSALAKLLRQAPPVTPAAATPN